MKTEYEMMIEMLKRSGTVFRTLLVTEDESAEFRIKKDPRRHYLLYLFEGGYYGFYTEFHFDKEGLLLEYAAYEGLDSAIFDSDHKEKEIERGKCI